MMVKKGDIVKINPIWFGYDNILPQWTKSVFLILDVYKDKKRIAEYNYFVCNVLTPDGTQYEFYDYELAALDEQHTLDAG